MSDGLIGFVGGVGVGFIAAIYVIVTALRRKRIY